MIDETEEDSKKQNGIANSNDKKLPVNRNLSKQLSGIVELSEVEDVSPKKTNNVNLGEDNTKESTEKDQSPFKITYTKASTEKDKSPSKSTPENTNSEKEQTEVDAKSGDTDKSNVEIEEDKKKVVIRDLQVILTKHKDPLHTTTPQSLKKNSTDLEQLSVETSPEKVNNKKQDEDDEDSKQIKQNTYITGEIRPKISVITTSNQESPKEHADEPPEKNTEVITTAHLDESIKDNINQCDRRSTNKGTVHLEQSINSPTLKPSASAKQQDKTEVQTTTEKPSPLVIKNDDTNFEDSNASFHLHLSDTVLNFSLEKSVVQNENVEEETCDSGVAINTENNSFDSNTSDKENVNKNEKQIVSNTANTNIEIVVKDNINLQLSESEDDKCIIVDDSSSNHEETCSKRKATVVDENRKLSESLVANTTTASIKDICLNFEDKMDCSTLQTSSVTTTSLESKHTNQKQPDVESAENCDEEISLSKIEDDSQLVPRLELNKSPKANLLTADINQETDSEHRKELESDHQYQEQVNNAGNKVNVTVRSKSKSPKNTKHITQYKSAVAESTEESDYEQERTNTKDESLENKSLQDTKSIVQDNSTIVESSEESDNEQEVSSEINKSHKSNSSKDIRHVTQDNSIVSESNEESDDDESFGKKAENHKSKDTDSELKTTVRNTSESPKRAIQNNPVAAASSEESNSEEELCFMLSTDNNKKDELSSKIDALVEGTIANDSDSDISASHYIDDMAEEVLMEDTPSEGSNDIIDEGESVNSTDSEYGSSGTYEEDSFIDDEEYELLSGNEVFETSSTMGETKRTRKAEAKDSKDDKKAKKKSTNNKQKWARIVQVSDSSDTEEIALAKSVDASQGAPEKSTENVDDSDVTEVLEFTASSFRKENSPIKLVEEDRDNSIQESTSTNTTLKRVSSITILENVSVDEIKDKDLSKKISEVVRMLCTPEKRNSGNVKLNVSVGVVESDVEVPAKSDQDTEQNEQQKEVVTTDSENTLDFQVFREQKVNKTPSKETPAGSKSLKKVKASSGKKKVKDKTNRSALGTSNQLKVPFCDVSDSESEKSDIEDHLESIIRLYEPQSDDLFPSIQKKIDRRMSLRKDASATDADKKDTEDDSENEMKKKNRPIVSEVTSKNNSQKKTPKKRTLLVENEFMPTKRPENDSEHEMPILESHKKKNRQIVSQVTSKDKAQKKRAQSVENDFLPTKRADYGDMKVDYFPSKLLAEVLQDEERKKKEKRLSKVVTTSTTQNDWDTEIVSTKPTTNNDINETKEVKSVQKKSAKGKRKQQAAGVSPAKKCKFTGSFHVKDFKSKMLFNSNRVKRMETKKLLLKKQKNPM